MSAVHCALVDDGSPHLFPAMVITPMTLSGLLFIFVL
jgi:hypothetical protein